MEQVSFNFMASVAICSEFGGQENKICHDFHYSPSICREVMWLDAMTLIFWKVGFKPVFSILLFHLHQEAFSSIQSPSHVKLVLTPWTAACQASLSVTNFQRLLKLMSIQRVMLSNHLILCHPLLLPSIFPRIKVFSNESVLHNKWPKLEFQLQHHSFQWILRTDFL